MIINTCHLLGEHTPLHDFVNKAAYEILRYSSCPATAIAYELRLVFRTQIFHKTRAQLRFLGQCRN